MIYIKLGRVKIEGVLFLFQEIHVEQKRLGYANL